MHTSKKDVQKYGLISASGEKNKQYDKKTLNSKL